MGRLISPHTPEGPLAQPPQWHARPVPFRVGPCADGCTPRGMSSSAGIPGDGCGT